MRETNNILAFLLGIMLVIGVTLILMANAQAQDTQVMRCVNGKGQVVYVTNYTCPPGYWRG